MWKEVSRFIKERFMARPCSTVNKLDRTNRSMVILYSQ